MEKHTTDSLKARMDEMQIGDILIVPLEEEKKEFHAVRTRKRLNSYG